VAHRRDTNDAACYGITCEITSVGPIQYFRVSGYIANWIQSIASNTMYLRSVLMLYSHLSLSLRARIELGSLYPYQYTVHLSKKDSNLR
jgi:hypothetical protein